MRGCLLASIHDCIAHTIFMIHVRKRWGSNEGVIGLGFAHDVRVTKMGGGGGGGVVVE